MVYSAKDWIRDNVSELFDWPSAGRVFPERNVRPRLIVIGSIFRKDSSKLLDVEYEQMIRALAPDRADQAFNIAILPGRAVRRGPVPDPHCSHTSLECNMSPYAPSPTIVPAPSAGAWSVIVHRVVPGY